MAVYMNKRLLKAKAAADYLSISRSKLYEWAKQGKIKSVRIDNCRRFDVQKLDEFINSLENREL
jgi:excisionase family DNA binding protein